MIDQRRENNRVSKTLNDESVPTKQKHALLSPVSEHQKPGLVKVNNESTLMGAGK